VDEILSHLLDSLGALKAVSLTCKCLFGATRPFIHQRLVCVDLRPDSPIPKGFSLSRYKGDPEAFELLIDADSSGVLHYTRHLTFKPKRDSHNPHFEPGDLREYLPHLRSITKLHALTLDSFDLPQFIPVFNEYFGTFTNTLRHLGIRDPDDAKRDLLYIISQFLLLEDLTIVSLPSYPISHLWHPVPTITQSPPLRGKLTLVDALSRTLFDGLAAFPSGLSFRSLELHWCGRPQSVLAACGHTVTSISFLSSPGDADGESNTPTQVGAMI